MTNKSHHDRPGGPEVESCFTLGDPSSHDVNIQPGNIEPATRVLTPPLASVDAEMCGVYEARQVSDHSVG